MASKTLFASLRGAFVPNTDTTNSENAPAYAMPKKHALAQYAATGCLGHTFYATAGEQLERVLQLCEDLEPEFVAKVAIYSRKQAFMKDMPALLCAWLSVRDARLHELVFAQVIDDTRMLRNYVQILRSGVVGRKSLGSAPKRLVREWLASRDEEMLFRSSVRQNPSLSDIVKMVHPKPAGDRRQAFYGYMLSRTHEANALPRLILQFEQFKTGDSLEVPDLPFMLLSALPLSKADWAEVAKNASWQTTRLNLNTFARHGVFEDAANVKLIAERLRDPAAIARARVFPYQLLAAYLNCSADIPAGVRRALQDAMELATAQVPSIEGSVVVCPDVSGSMLSPVTGDRGSGTTSVRCIDVAALVTAAILRKNRSAQVMPFAESVREIDLNPQDSVMTNAEKLAAIGGGGTSCSRPITLLNNRNAKVDLVILVSDNESWMDPAAGRGTALMEKWSTLRQRNPKARLVCLDIQPNTTLQAVEREDILNIGGFSDRVFEMISDFAREEQSTAHWVERIEAISI